MNQLTMGLLVAVGLFCFFLYNENQTLTQNNIKLEAAVEEQQRAMEVMMEAHRFLASQGALEITLISGVTEILSQQPLIYLPEIIM